MTERFRLQKTQYMPANLEPGVLYVAEKYGAAAHLCACGCGTIVRTPLNRWTLTETNDGPSLDPSVGNWQEACRSHYWIERGEVKWAEQWSAEEVAAGRVREKERLSSHYDLRDRQRSWLWRLWRWLKFLF